MPANALISFDHDDQQQVAGFKLLKNNPKHIQDVEFLIQLGSHKGFDLKATRVQRMNGAAPRLGYGLCVLCVLRNVGRTLNPCRKCDLGSRDDRIFHDRFNSAIVNDNVGDLNGSTQYLLEVFF